MSADAEAIRALVDTWLRATQRGDVDTVLSLMTEDVIFLVAGQPPMDRASFEKQARAQAGADAPRIEGTSQVEEVEVLGDLAFARSKLALAITPPGGASPIQRAGHTLTVFRRVEGRWLLARDANLLIRVLSSARGLGRGAPRVRATTGVPPSARCSGGARLVSVAASRAHATNVARAQAPMAVS